MIESWLADVPVVLVRVWLLAFGLILGSFLNVVIHRLPRGISVVFPRSACPSCRRQLSWLENVPVLSWILQRGRCRGCGARISPRYLLVEALTATLVVAAHAELGLTLGLPIAILFIALIEALVFIDLEHLLLPDALTLPGAWLGLALAFVSPLTDPADALLGVLLALFVIEALNLAYRLLRGRDGMGAGDTKMLILIAAFLGWEQALLTLLLACLVGVVVGVPLLAVLRLRRRPAAAEADDAEAPAAEEAPTSAIDDLLPRRACEATGPFTFVILALSFLPGGRPDWAVGGLLAGVAVMAGLRVLSRRRAAAADRSRTDRLHDFAPAAALLGAIAGLPTSALGLAAATLAVVLAAAAWATWRPDERAEPPATDSAQTWSPDFMQAALPFGVFLGAAALMALFLGQELTSWYVDLLARGAA